MTVQLVSSAERRSTLQVPRDVTEEQLAPLFEQCGEVLHLNILRTQKGQSSGKYTDWDTSLQLLPPQNSAALRQLTICFAAPGCAFVQFRKWAEAEAAIDLHNAKTALPGAEVPLVVKFADARKKDGFANGMKRGILADPWADKRQLGGGIPDAFLQVGHIIMQDSKSSLVLLCV